MNMSKRVVTAIATALVAFAAASLQAGTYTWTGAGNDGLWFTAGNWNYEGSPATSSPGNAPADDVVIANGDTVTYVPGGDWVPTGSTTISGSSKLVQSEGAAWPNVLAPLELNGGTYDTGSSGNFRLGSTLTVGNGGVFILRCTQANPDNNGLIVLEDGGTVTRTGEWTGAIPVEFNGGEMTVDGVFTSNAGDIYNGGEIVATGEFHPLNGLAVTGTVITCSLYSPQSADSVATFVGGGLVCTSTSFDGFYQNAGVYIDIPSNSTATFTMPVAASSVYSAYFSNGKFRFAGETVSAEDFENIIDVQAVDASHSRFSLARATDWKLGSLSTADVSASAATVSAIVEATGDGAYSVYVACDTTAITEENVIVKGEAVAESGGIYSKTFSALETNTVYNYGFAIVTNGVVAAFKSDSFVASDYDYVWMDGAWLGAGAPPNFEVDKNVLFMNGNFTTGTEISPSNKKMVNVVVTAPTLVNGSATGTAADALELCNSTYTNTKDSDLNGVAAYGVYNCQRPLNFTTQSGNGVIRRASTYTCYATEEQCGDVYARLFDNNSEDASLRRKVLVDGVEIVEATFAEVFTTNSVATEKTITIGEDLVPLRQLSIMRWEQLPANAAGNWTFKDGARVKLNRNTKIAALTVESADVKIDLNGFKLTVSSLTVGGVTMKGEYTSATLSCLVGEGSLSVAGQGLVIVIR